MAFAPSAPMEAPPLMLHGAVEKEDECAREGEARKEESA